MKGGPRIQGKGRSGPRVEKEAMEMGGQTGGRQGTGDWSRVEARRDRARAATKVTGR